jgi:hypothetical protein
MGKLTLGGWTTPKRSKAREENSHIDIHVRVGKSLSTVRSYVDILQVRLQPQVCCQHLQHLACVSKAKENAIKWESEIHVNA